MSGEGSAEATTVACPLCGAPAARGCVMSGSAHWLRWFGGAPSFWKSITAGVFITSPGDPVGDMGILCGAYVEGIRCTTCNKIICEAVDPNRR
jgi:hypothetical protein